MSTDSPGRIKPALPYSVQAANIVRAAILNGRYELGQRLNEVELSAELGISRSPLREGLQKLINEGLIRPVNGRGIFVARPTLAEVKDLLEIRLALDPLAAQFCAERASEAEVEALSRGLDGLVNSHLVGAQGDVGQIPDFHMMLFEASKNQKLRELGTMVHSQLRLVRFRSASSEQRLTDAQSEHLAILEALSARDARSARELTVEHVSNGGTHILEVLSD